VILEPRRQDAALRPASRATPVCRAVGVLTAALVSACTVPGTMPIVPAPLVLTGNEIKPPAPAPDPVRAQTLIEKMPAPPAAAPTRTADAREAAAVAGATAAGEPVTINLEQVQLGTFAQLVFADLLKKNVNIDPQVLARKDLVTFRSGAAQPPAQLENAAKLLLKSYGVAVIDVGGLVRVVPDNANLGNLPEIRRGAALPDTPLPLRPVFQLVELQAVQQTAVVGWLRTMFGERIRAQEDITRNAILLSGTPDNMQAALEAIRILDQPILRGVQSTAISPVYWSADDLARRLVEVLSAEGYAVQPINQAAGGVRYPIVILPVSGINAVYVFASGGEVLNHITNWARNLDRPNERGVGKNYFTYTVKHKDASVLAATIEQLLSRNRVQAGVAAVAAAAGAAAGNAPAAAPQRTGAVVVDVSSNMLIFQTGQEEYSQVISLLQTLDRPAKAALIEVTVAELLLDDKSQLGVEWLATQALSNGGQLVAGTNNGLAIGTAGFNLRIFDVGGALRFALNALASDNKASVLSSPRVLARNGETATIQVGQEVPIVTSQQSTNASSVTGAQILQTIQYRNTGVILKVKPVIHSSDQIDLDVTQEVSAAQSTSTGVNVSPTFTTRRIDTKLTLRNGSTVLLGGLISDESSRGSAGIPWLKDVPVVGSLFSTQTGSGTRRELIMLITPYVINDDHDAEAVTSAFRKMLGPWAETMPTASKAGPAAGAASAPATTSKPAAGDVPAPAAAPATAPTPGAAPPTR
jgi:general secretion pathway protein D